MWSPTDVEDMEPLWDFHMNKDKLKDLWDIPQTSSFFTLLEPQETLNNRSFVEEYAKQMIQGDMRLARIEFSKPGVKCHQNNNSSEEKSQKYSAIFDSIRKYVSDTPTNIPQKKIAVNKELEDVFQNLPEPFMKRLLQFLDHKSLLDSRLISKEWNALITTSDRFLNSVIFVVGPHMELIQMCKMTEVKWRLVKTQLVPCSEVQGTKSKSNYGRKFIVNKLVEGPNWIILSSCLKTIILDKVEIQRESLTKWMVSCPQLTKLEFSNCTFKKCCNVRSQPVGRVPFQKICERLTHVIIRDMSLVNLLETSKLILSMTKVVEVLEISQKGFDCGSQEIQSLAIKRKMLEVELLSTLKSALESNTNTLKDLKLCFELFKTSKILATFYKNLPVFGLSLYEFGFEVREENEKLVVDPREISLDKTEVEFTLRKLMKSSPHLKKVHLPFLRDCSGKKSNKI